MSVWLLLGSGPAWAWVPNGAVWTTQPIRWCVDDTVAEATRVATDRWNAVGGPCFEEVAPPCAGDDTDGIVTITRGSVPIGFPAVTTMSFSDETVDVDGLTLRGAADASVVVPETDDPSCALPDLLTHELGHLLGLDHPCEDPSDGPCTDAERESLMGGSFCEGIPRSDDRDGVLALYGDPAACPDPPVVLDSAVDTGSSPVAADPPADTCGCRTSAGSPLLGVLAAVALRRRRARRSPAFARRGPSPGGNRRSRDPVRPR